MRRNDERLFDWSIISLQTTWSEAPLGNNQVVAVD